ncbi:MAG: hypothetical protein ACOZF2_11245 [Thermodesulfobacteriota bacterium]
MEYQRDESAKWSHAVNEAAQKLEDATQEALARNAARGFPGPTGPTLALILQAGHETQMHLTQANAQIYGEQRQRIFEVEEFALKLAVEAAKLLMDWYKAQLLNDLAMEQAEYEAQIDRWRGDIIHINAETERREAAIIYAKAEIEHEINGYKKQQLEAEFLTLDAEVRLIDAKIATAEAKLQIIDSLWEVIRAEHLVVAAEQRRAAALQLVLEAKKRLAEVQKTMVPLYLEKAHAREEQAEATIEEAEVKRRIEELGYDRIRLRDAQEAADHEVREAEGDYEIAQENLTRITKAVELIRNRNRRLLQEYQNVVRESLLNRQAQLKKFDIDLRLDSALERKRQDTEGDIEIMNYLQGLANLEWIAKVKNLKDVGKSNAATISASAFQTYKSTTYTTFVKQVIKGSASIA